jgi:hypothetical protein
MFEALHATKALSFINISLQDCLVVVVNIDTTFAMPIEGASFCFQMSE